LGLLHNFYSRKIFCGRKEYAKYFALSALFKTVKEI